MKPLFLTLCFPFLIKLAAAQVTNTQAGTWNNPSNWSSSAIPTSNDDVSLSYDVVIDADAYCRSLTLNGHGLTVNAGANLFITGISQNNDSLLTRYLYIDTTVSPADTVATFDFTYDSLKRNTVIHSVEYDAGDVYQDVTDSFFYNADSRLPYRAVNYQVEYSGEDPTYYYTEYFFIYQGGRLSIDSSAAASIHYFYFADTVVQQTTHYPGAQISSDTFKLQWDAHGNIIQQSDSSQSGSLRTFHFEFDTHPNPFKNTQRNLHRVVNSMETFNTESFAVNNLLHVDQYYDSYHYEALYQYRYNANGYPVEMWEFAPGDTEVQEKALFFYTR